MYSISQLDPYALVYALQSFPGDLVRAIVSESMVTFIDHDGEVVMKTMHCLSSNGEISIDGLPKNELDAEKLLTRRKASKKHSQTVI